MCRRASWRQMQKNIKRNPLRGREKIYWSLEKNDLHVWILFGFCPSPPTKKLKEMEEKYQPHPCSAQTGGTQDINWDLFFSVDSRETERQGVSSRSFDLLNSMINWSRWPVDSKWIIEHRCYIHLVFLNSYIYHAQLSLLLVVVLSLLFSSKTVLSLFHFGTSCFSLVQQIASLWVRWRPFRNENGKTEIKSRGPSWRTQLSGS